MLPIEALPIPHRIKEALKGRDAIAIFKEAAPYCAVYLINCIVGKRFKPSWSRIEVAKYVIDQVHGRAKIKAELTGAGGAPLDWRAVMVLAGMAEEMLASGQLPPLGGDNGGKTPVIVPADVSPRALMVVEQPEEDTPEKP